MTGRISARTDRPRQADGHAATRAVIVYRAYVAPLLMCAPMTAVVTAANVSTTLDPAFALEAVFTSV